VHVRTVVYRCSALHQQIGSYGWTHLRG
jgi:hypothetical protein